MKAIHSDDEIKALDSVFVNRYARHVWSSPRGRSTFSMARHRHGRCSSEWLRFYFSFWKCWDVGLPCRRSEVCRFQKRCPGRL